MPSGCYGAVFATSSSGGVFGGIPPYVVDFACPEARLVVEADGGQHAVDGEHVLRDEELHRKGWRVLHLWNNDILENPTGVLQTIVSALGPPP